MRKCAPAIAFTLVFLTPACAPEPSAQTTMRDAVPNQTRTKPQDESTSAAVPNDTSVVVGELADNFPAELFPVGSDDEVLLSSLALTSADQYSVSLNVRTKKEISTALAAYEETLTSAGFEKVGTAKVEGMAVQETFARAKESLTVGVLDEGDARIITIGGTISLD